MIAKRTVAAVPPRRVPPSLTYRVSSMVAMAGIVLAGFGLPSPRPAHRSLLAGASLAASVPSPPGYLTQIANGVGNAASGAGVSQYTPIEDSGGFGVINWAAGPTLNAAVLGPQGPSSISQAPIFSYSGPFAPILIEDHAVAMAVSPTAINGDYVVAVATSFGFIDIFDETAQGNLNAVGAPYSPLGPGGGSRGSGRWPSAREARAHTILKVSSLPPLTVAGSRPSR